MKSKGSARMNLTIESTSPGSSSSGSSGYGSINGGSSVGSHPPSPTSSSRSSSSHLKQKVPSLPLKYPILVSIVSIVLYSNSYYGDFAYDDSRAIKTNQDLRPESSLSSLWSNDFWGTPLTHSGSHKSYRPLCVLSFRLNYYLHGLDPRGFHLVNILLHSLVSTLFTFLSFTLCNRNLRCTLLSSLLFSCHPIHTEAVAGIVGRSDSGSGLFFLLSLFSYIQYTKHMGEKRRFLYLYGALVLACASMLTKETGITVLGVCAVYHLVVYYREGDIWGDLPWRDLIKVILFKRRFRSLREGLGHLTMSAVLFLSLRLWLMGLKTPAFAQADNPAAEHPSFLVRSMTFLFLPVFNFYLLLNPTYLSFDWSMDSIPLVRSILDPRNMLSLLFYGSLLMLVRKLILQLKSSAIDQHRTLISPSPFCVSCSVKSSTDIGRRKSSQSVHHRFFNNNNNNNNNEVCKCFSRDLIWFKTTSAQLLSRSEDEDCDISHSSGFSDGHDKGDDQLMDAIWMSLALMVVPFLPATNIFFYVGFVVAERILYVPSMGFCILCSVAFELVLKRFKGRFLTTLYVCTGILLLSLSLRTVSRTHDWKNELNLYRSGIPINPAKSYGNLGNILSSHGMKQDAEDSYRKALTFRPNMADVHYNLGILLQEQNRLEESLVSYNLAIRFRPRLAMAYLNKGIVLSALGRKEEAIKVYRDCSSLDGEGLKDPKAHEATKISALFNLGKLYSDSGDLNLAIELYQEALDRMPAHYPSHSLHNMMGEAYAKMGQLDSAETSYRKSLNVKPDHVPAHLTLAKLLVKQNRMEEAESLFKRALDLSPTDSSVYQHYGQFLADVGRFAESAQIYGQAVQVSPNEFEVVFNGANAMRQASRMEEAESLYRRAATLKPSEVTSHMNLGAMLHLNGKLKEAESSYLEALKLRPDDKITQGNLQKLRHLMKKKNIN